MTPTRFLALCLMLTLAGCGLFTSRHTRALRASPDYRSGYSDGCASAGGPDANPRDDTTVRDEELYAKNPAYRTGWNSGRGACRTMAPDNRAPTAGPIRDVSPGARRPF